MKKLILVLFLVLLIQNIAAHPQQKRQMRRNHKKHARKSLSAAQIVQKTAAPITIIQKHHQQQQQQQQREQQQQNHDTSSSADYRSDMLQTFASLEVDILKCPLGCVCQYAHLFDLPISRWINYMQMRQPDKANSAETSEERINNNEATYEIDDMFPTNPYIKQATCILQEDNDPDELVNSLPHDLQALILLYTGIGKNKTVKTSSLKPLNQLSTLEIRGPQDRTFRLIFDEPLSFLQNANFESITLMGSDDFKRPKNPVHPSESFDYKPRSELLATYETVEQTAEDSANMSAKRSKVGFNKPEDEIEILPYEVYRREVIKARMPTFYGWEHLEVLRIQACELNELHWEMFDGLEALQHLSLERNAIEKIPAFALYGAMNIKTLSLAHNNIHDMHYRDLAGLLELEMLDLSDNRLTKLSEMSFPPFPKLVRVDFRSNPIKYIFPATFWVMNGTREMFFDSRDTPLELWGNMPYESLVELRELTLGNVSISNLEHNIFKGLASLRKLKVKGDIRSIEFDAFAGLAALREIDLSNCQIREISMDAFMGCKSLEILNLANNNISYIPPGLFDDQYALEEIYLNGNQLRTLPTTFFLQPKLRLARLNENPWKCSCDMYNWRPKITNQAHGGPRSERCLTDYQTGKKFACRRIENSKFDQRLAPRCASHNLRSVYYVLRKQMHCDAGRVVHAARRRPRTQHNNNNNETTSQQQSTGLLWQIQREQKMRRTSARENSLEYILQKQERRRLSQKSTAAAAARQASSRTSEEISNEI